MKPRTWKGIVALMLVFMSVSSTMRGGERGPGAFPGDNAFRDMDYGAAMRAYDSVIAVQPNNAQAFWRLARVQVCIGDTVPHSDQEVYYRSAVDFAEKCIAADSTIAEGHSWLAAALGNVAMFEGSRRKVQLCDTIKHELDLALQLNPGDDLAYSILGSFYRALGNVSWIERTLANLLYGSLPPGGFAEGETALKKAIAIAPDVMRHHYELGRLYRDWGKESEAAVQFKIAAQCPVLLVRDRRTMERARRESSRQ